MTKKAKNGQGSVYFDKSKNSWRARITDFNGKLISKRLPTKELAEQWLIITRANMLTGSYIQPQNITIGEWITEFIDIYCKPNIRFKTYVGYLQTAMHLQTIAKLPLQTTNSRQLQGFINQLTMAASTKIKIYRLLKSAFSRAVMLGMVNNNPMLAVRPPKQEQKIIDVFTSQELNSILDYLQPFPRWYALVRLASETGMRIGEILGLKPANITDGFISVECSLSDVLGKAHEELPKTKSGYRKLPVCGDLIALLRKICGQKYVFETVTGNSLRVSNVERMWRNIFTHLDIPFRNFHVLRHTFATLLLSKGVPLNDVAAYLGHSKPSHTLNLYGHAIKARTAEIPNIINKEYNNHD